MENSKFIYLKSVLILLLILTALSSCKDDDTNEIILEPIELDCSSSPSSGETVTLEDRSAGVDYIINCLYSVAGDFIVDPGVTIQFGTDAGIKVAGSIQLLGTAEDQVVFTGEDKTPGAWRGVFIDSNDSKNKIEFTTIEYAGGDSFNSNGDKGAVIVWSDTRLDMNNTTIVNSEAFGFNASYGGAELTLVNNTITLCNAPMYVEGAYPTAISGGSYIGNTIDAIIVESDQLRGDHTWSKLDVPYHLPNGMQVIPDGRLNILPGVVLRFGQDSRLFINEGASGPKPSLIAVGTQTEPIIFTSIDNTLSAWQGIYFDSPSTLNEIGFATIENASNQNQSGAIETWFGSVLNVHDVMFVDIQDCAIFEFISNGGQSSVSTSNLIYDNVGNTYCTN